MSKKNNSKREGYEEVMLQKVLANPNQSARSALARAAGQMGMTPKILRTKFRFRMRKTLFERANTKPVVYEGGAKGGNVPTSRVPCASVRWRSQRASASSS